MSRFKIFSQQFLKTLRFQNPFGNRVDHDVVELGHWHPLPPAGDFPLLQPVYTRVVAVLAAFAGVEYHGRPTVTAAHDPGQQRRRGDDARSDPLRRPALQKRLCCIEGCLIDDGRDFDLNPL
nr:hypothetical protein [Novosphingobium sp. ERN07]